MLSYIVKATTSIRGWAKPGVPTNHAFKVNDTLVQLNMNRKHDLQKNVYDILDEIHDLMLSINYTEYISAASRTKLTLKYKGTLTN